MAAERERVISGCTVRTMRFFFPVSPFSGECYCCSRLGKCSYKPPRKGRKCAKVASRKGSSIGNVKVLGMRL